MNSLTTAYSTEAPASAAKPGKGTEITKGPKRFCGQMSAWIHLGDLCVLCGGSPHVVEAPCVSTGMVFGSGGSRGDHLHHPPPYGGGFTGLRASRQEGQAFTLVELMVVLTVIGLLSAIVLPTMLGLFTAGSDAQAYNVLAGQLVAARSLAIQKRTHAGVHAQLADPNGTYTKTLRDTCFTAVVWDDPDPAAPAGFTLAEGFSPQKLPGSIVFARVPGTYSDMDEFFTLTFVFAPSGQLDDRNVGFDRTHVAFEDRNDRGYLWDPTVANGTGTRESVKVAVMFDLQKFRAVPEQEWPDWLLTHGQIIAVNTYTGTLLGR